MALPFVVSTLVPPVLKPQRQTSLTWALSSRDLCPGDNPANLNNF